MARQNVLLLRGTVANKPRIIKHGDSYLYAMVSINTARGVREVGDGSRYMKCENPIIMSRSEPIIRQIETWEKRDIVNIYGVIESKHIGKASICPHCGRKNSIPGALVFGNPIFVEKLGHLNTDQECLQYLAAHREISNKIYVDGTLVRDPKLRKWKGPDESGQGISLVITQYQIALNRKYRDFADPPECKTDYPWVRSIGKSAEQDRDRLHVGSDVQIDGFFAVRSVNRHAVCGQAYSPKGKALRYEGTEPVMVLERDADGNPIPNGNGGFCLTELKDEAGNVVLHKAHSPVMIQAVDPKTGYPLYDKDGLPVNAGCGETYDWKDRAAELVPYANATEYLGNVYTDEEVEEHRKAREAQRARDLAAKDTVNFADEGDKLTEDDLEAGIDELKPDKKD